MNKTFTRVYWLTCVLLTLVAAAASATTIVMPTDEQLIEKSPVIVRGLVLSSAPVERNGGIWTETLLQVDEHIKGDSASSVTIREVGGVIGDHITKVYGSPEYAKGEYVLAFLTPTPRGDYQTIDLFVGKFTEARTTTGQRLWNRDSEVADVTLLDSNFKPIASANVQRDAAKFEQFVADRVSGFEGAQNYGVENPVIQHRPQIAPNFTLISEPTVYRWFTFDTGGSANWYSSGTQPGYTGGGVNEATTAMNVWTGFASAKINYRYAGTFSGTPGGNGTPNGKNEIDFNDPLNEIAGSWNPSTGGVVGQGGFNGVGNSANWNSPFAADPSHPQQTYRAWNIVEGNLVVQDGVSPQAHISSQTLAEIVAHEFGHTLGFGHSADNTALMYATVTGLGPSLRPDDQTAARWLYPNGASTPPPPPPPTQQPVSAAFSMTPSSGIAGQTTFTFSDQSTGPVASRMWNLGDGTTSTAASLSHVYSTPGAYTVSLTVSGNGTQSQATRVATVNSNQPALAAAFAYSPSSPLAGDPVAFSDGSTGGVTSWVWNFGDGTASSVQNPVKTYANAGSYNVTLTVYRNAESKVSVQTISVGTKIPATPQAGPFASLVPVTAQTNGANGSIWRTELTLFNAGPETANVNLTFVPGAGVPAQVRAIAVLPRETRTYANALRDIFGMPAGAGGISIQATSATTTPDLRIASRTFAATTNGTYGQAVPDVASSDLQSTTYLTGIISTNDFRTNIGLVNKSGNTVVAALSLFDANGGNVENINLTIPPNSFQQGSLAGYFASTSGRSLPLLSLRIATTNRDVLSAYASVVDNKTQDPVYIQAVPLPGSGPVTVPVVGRTNGANGTFWRSDVTLFNPNSLTSNVTLTYRSSTATRSRSFGLTPNNSATIADLITWMGESAGSGMLEVTWNGGAPVVTSRTYTTDGNGGTFGQSVDPVGGFNRQQYVTGLRSDIDFRTNVGFVNGGNAPVNVGIVVLSASGAQIGSGSITLAPRSQAQYPLSAFVQSVNQNSIGSCTLQAQTDGASTLFVYGSVVDNASGDPVLFAGN